MQGFHSLDLSRRRLLRGAGLGLGATALLGATFAAAPAAASAKFSQSMARYQPKPKGDQRCANCMQFQPPDACKVVAGKISPNGWCLLYARAG